MAVLIWSIIFGVLSYYVANEKGRSAGAWAILGFLFGLIALLIIICLPDRNE